ncbi:polysaccharide deacetylase family protein [Candidatus Woesearchaeota archaeon]|nr:polysaccharide deacetylase family protein [Candidatus Woesearchaeota archaeon]
MVNICMYFQVHQPFRLRNYTVFDIGNNSKYFDTKKNEEICKKVANKCYLPTNKIILDLIKQTNGRFRVAFSISGCALEQFHLYSPEVIQSFRELANTGCVEFLSETYYHSLAYLQSKEEFVKQVNLHKSAIKTIFGQEPTIFRNTELIFNNELANFIESLGYTGILAEGADHILNERSPNLIYGATYSNNIKVLLKNYKLSDDIAFRFSNKDWKEWPLTAEKYVSWINNNSNNNNNDNKDNNKDNGDDETINLFMDYETFGEHQWESTGIFDFLKQFPIEFLKLNKSNNNINDDNNDNSFLLPSEVAKKNIKDIIDVHNFISWADIERDLSAWLGNQIQRSAFHELYQLEKEITETNDKKLMHDWRKLQTSDHFYYMCTKWFEDGDVHKYFNPYESPYDAFITFMNILKDIKIRIRKANENNLKEKDINENNELII